MTLITHHGITLEITDTLTFEMARLLWKDICREFEGEQIPHATGIIPGTLIATLPADTVIPARLSVSLGGSGYKFIRAASSQVKQIAGKNPAFGTGDVTKIHPNGSITVEFYDSTRTLRPEELDFYHKEIKGGKE